MNIALLANEFRAESFDAPTAILSIIIILPLTLCVLASTNHFHIQNHSFADLRVNANSIEDLELARAGRALLVKANDSGETGLEALNNLSADMSSESDHNQLSDAVLNHYGITVDQFNILSSHFDTLNVFNNLLLNHSFEIGNNLLY